MRPSARIIAGALAVAVSTLPFAMPVAHAQGKAKKRTAPVTLSTAAPGTLGFTPAAADPKFAAGVSRAGVSEKMFRFTPAGMPGSKKSVTVAVRSRSIVRPETVQTTATPSDAIAVSGYDLGVSIGWSRFALSGGVSKVDSGLSPFGRESVDVGLSYLGHNWRGTLQVGSEREADSAARVLGREQSYSVDLGGAYSVSRNLSLSGGIRYKRDEAFGLMSDSRRDSQSVYVGTSFSF